jgi:hypothetical protein
MIINYFRYVDDILLIFDSTQTNTQSILTDFNSVHPNLHFIAEIEQNNTNYLDISIYKLNTIYKYPHAENPPSLTPLSRTHLITLPNINTQPSDTSTIDYTHTN